MGFKRNTLGMAVIGALKTFASSADANTKRCDFTSWSGSPQLDISQSWVGLGFEVDESASRLRVFRPRGTTDWVMVTSRQTPRFTTFVTHSQDRSSSGRNINNRYGFRVYADGRCETLMDNGVYVPIVGRGNLK